MINLRPAIGRLTERRKVRAQIRKRLANQIQGASRVAL